MGDAGAFGQLIERHYRCCLSKAYSILRNHGDAEDEVQNACAKAWTHLGQYHGEGPFGGWLSRIVSNQCLMRIRERKNARTISVDEVFDSEFSFRVDVIDQQALPEEAVGNDEVSRVLNREILRVPYRLREALVMRDLQHLGMQDVAANLGISIAAAKSRLMRARCELRQRLLKHHGAKGWGTMLPGSPRRRVAYVRAN
jgi:RNA polymerase sigma-70 factor (ECF subfamily)